jgi:hypothetical protein
MYITLLLRIQERPGSVLGCETGYPEMGVTSFTSVLPGKGWDKSSQEGKTTSLHIHFNLLVTNRFVV